MPSADGPGGDDASEGFDGADRRGSVEAMLFEALVHQLIEKGLLTKNDSLSIVQTVAQVKCGQVDESSKGPNQIEAELALLRRLYESYQALRDRPASSRGGQNNVRQLRPPIHRDQPEFPTEK